MYEQLYVTFYGDSGVPAGIVGPFKTRREAEAVVKAIVQMGDYRNPQITES